MLPFERRVITKIEHRETGGGQLCMPESEARMGDSCCTVICTLLCKWAVSTVQFVAVVLLLIVIADGCDLLLRALRLEFPGSVAGLVLLLVILLIGHLFSSKTQWFPKLVAVVDVGAIRPLLGILIMLFVPSLAAIPVLAAEDSVGWSDWLKLVALLIVLMPLTAVGAGWLFELVLRCRAFVSALLCKRTCACVKIHEDSAKNQAGRSENCKSEPEREEVTDCETGRGRASASVGEPSSYASSSGCHSGVIESLPPHLPSTYRGFAEQPPRLPDGETRELFRTPPPGVEGTEAPGALESPGPSGRNLHRLVGVVDSSTNDNADKDRGLETRSEESEKHADTDPVDQMEIGCHVGVLQPAVSFIHLGTTLQGDPTPPMGQTPFEEVSKETAGPSVRLHCFGKVCRALPYLIPPLFTMCLFIGSLVLGSFEDFKACAVSLWCPSRWLNFFLFLLEIPLVFLWGRRLQSRAVGRWFHPLLNPQVLTLLSVWVLAAALATGKGGNWTDFLRSEVITHASFNLFEGLRGSDRWVGAGNVYLYLLQPAVVALSVPMYLRLEHWRPIVGEYVITTLAVAFISLVVTVAAASAIGLSPLVAKSAALRSASAAIAGEAAPFLGGNAELALNCACITGLVGGVLWKVTLRLSRLTDKRVRGLAVGSSCHGVGTSYLILEEPESAPYSAIAFTLVGIFSSFLVAIPPIRSVILVGLRE
uniref:Uncharacterized protein n=1 Tax=Chromera velia CCMP2878 TaxID=1169474 RepID=A0A0G4I3P1_9ALVE|eukprot:Cvel_10714.t1-p1 / transcript=Cvel_10714.t1 / gene=Cvel_10714 / organism=Chromera_velia_CCMP2878 / gene_product=Plastidal glycolate/glycerate translocator 1,, putative / transcript_product=Plastidal glycolate/glycerate translocator 1,, putative / location=Cvel_scaffold652:1597-5167(+) / protein_length=706 / sequence_SO=supercontig / SO=protein_coding / is_pseudo=false